MMPYSMNIVDYSLFFLRDVNLDLPFFRENSPGNEGVDMVSPLMGSLHYSPPHHLYSFKK